MTVSLPHGVTFEAEQPVLELANWLEQNCKGKWSVEVEDEYTAGAKVKILFETTRDKKSFIKDFG
jgi:hypothetical protein